MNPVAMLQRIMSIILRNPASSKIGCVAALMLMALSAVTPMEFAMIQDTPEAIESDCLKYHDEGAIDLEKEFKCQALDEGCAACHLDCSEVDPKADREEMPDHYLKAEEPDLCLECHATQEKDLAPAHNSQPLGESKCSGCHDPHPSDFPKGIPEYSHGPYNARLCSACHPDPEDGKVQLAADDVNSLCYGCHTYIKMQLNSAKSQHKLLLESDRSCVDCHDPHAANHEFVLKKLIHDLCIGCHEGKPEEEVAAKSKPRSGGMPSFDDIKASKRYIETQSMQYIDFSSKYIHEPARQSCVMCHDAHASEFTAELRAPEYDLCMNCHGKNSEKIIGSSQPFPLFGGLVSLPPGSFEKLTILDLSAEYIHEPVTKSCSFCHDPHASNESKGLYAPVQTLCVACHGSNAKKIMDSSRPFPLFGGRVNLPPKSFEKLTQIGLLENNTKGHPIQEHPVYVPATDEEPELNCMTCHDPHAASSALKRLKKDKESLCRDCHEM